LCDTLSLERHECGRDGDETALYKERTTVDVNWISAPGNGRIMGQITTYLPANMKRNKSFGFILQNIPYFILSDVVI